MAPRALQRGPTTILQRGPTTPRATPGDPQGWKCDQNFSFLVDPSAPKYHHAGLRNGVIWCQMALWSGPAAPPSPRSPGFCTWSLRWLALGPTLNAPFGASEWLPGPYNVDPRPFYHVGPRPFYNVGPRPFHNVGPRRPRPPQTTPRGENVTNFSVSWRTPVRQNTTMPDSGTELYGVKWHPGAVWRRRPAPGRPGFALGALGSSPWARP